MVFIYILYKYNILLSLFESFFPQSGSFSDRLRFAY